MIVYSDTSSLTKRYITEVESDWLSAVLDPAAHNEV